jgi:glutamate-ammonia-ligase adenylyltransferase
MMDIELLAQTLALQSAIPARQVERQIASGGIAAKLSQSDQTALLDAYRLFWRVQAASKLLSDKPLAAESIGEGGTAFLLREAGLASTDALTERLQLVAEAAETIIHAQLQG